MGCQPDVCELVTYYSNVACCFNVLKRKLMITSPVAKKGSLYRLVLVKGLIVKSLIGL